MRENKTKPKNDKTDILHHVGLIHSNLTVLTACYERLGFLLTPVSLPKIVLEPGEPPRALGAGNRHAIFQHNYLEFLGVVDVRRWAEITPQQRGPFDIDRPLARYAGLHVMHFGTDHIELVKKRLDRQGTPCSDISNFQRNVQTEAGKEQTMRARTIYFPPGSNPEGLIQIAQHDTPELVFQSRYMHHPNGATGLTEITICVEAPAEYASKYAQYSGRESFPAGKDDFIVDLGHSRIRVIRPDGLDVLIPGFVPPVVPFMAAVTVTTRDLLMTCNVLLRNGVPFIEKDDKIIVLPEYAGGCAIVFENE